MAWKTKLNTNTKSFFCLECDIKSFPNTYIEMEQKRMERKNDNEIRIEFC